MPFLNWHNAFWRKMFLSAFTFYIRKFLLNSNLNCCRERGEIITEQIRWMKPVRSLSFNNFLLDTLAQIVKLNCQWIFTFLFLLMNHFKKYNVLNYFTALLEVQPFNSKWIRQNKNFLSHIICLRIAIEIREPCPY